MSRFLDYSKNRQGGGAATVLQQREQPSGKASGTVTEVPKIDKENVLGSLSGMLGPTPAERAAEEERLQKHRRQMHGWTALFNGLRHLGNLYYATKGAPGQKFGEPHQQIEQQYQDERKRLADIHAADRNYYTSLYNIRRQMDDDERRNKLNDAQATWYGTREEVAKMKAENDRQKAEIEKLKKEAEIRRIDANTEYTKERTNTETGVNRDVKRAQAQRHRQAGQTAVTRANKTGSGKTISGYKKTGSSSVSKSSKGKAY